MESRNNSRKQQFWFYKSVKDKGNIKLEDSQSFSKSGAFTNIELKYVDATGTFSKLLFQLLCRPGATHNTKHNKKKGPIKGLPDCPKMTVTVIKCIFPKI